MLKVKRAYDKPATDNGTRILVDGLWPRGINKSEAGISEWIKELAPSAELRRWFGHEPGKFPEFRRKYIEELSAPEKASRLKRIAKLAEDKTVTLIYGARDTEHNNAVVLAELIGKLMKEEVDA